MNNTFSEYTRSASFHLSLSQNQIDCLLCFEGKTDYDCLVMNSWAMTSISCLKRKGLIAYENKHQLTDAGKIVCNLLREAGFKQRNQIVEVKKFA